LGASLGSALVAANAYAYQKFIARDAGVADCAVGRAVTAKREDIRACLAGTLAVIEAVVAYLTGLSIIACLTVGYAGLANSLVHKIARGADFAGSFILAGLAICYA
jgi:hypothetical protein